VVLERRQMRKNSWIWVAAAWFFVVRVSEYYALRIDLGHELTWEGSLRYTVVELGFWLIMTPVMARWAEKFPLERPTLVKNGAVLFLLNVFTELLYSSYRVKLHHFVYPDFAQHSFWRQSQTYLIDNSVIVAWFFWAIVGIHHAIKAARKSQQREQELVKAQLEMLKGQLQPHFLFNTLNSISWLMREDVEAADNMMTSLGELLRTTLSVSASKEVTLRRELNVLELYLAIERARFQDRLKVLVNANPETLDCRVPCLLLQPIVENAVRHGIARLDRPGCVEVRAACVGKELRISILDDGPGISTESIWREGIGLANTRARLEKHYGEMQSLRYTNRNEGGLIVEIRLPLRVQKNDDENCDRSLLRETANVNR
jgi:two-component system, LytTR family, sensor kinase